MGIGCVALPVLIGHNRDLFNQHTLDELLIKLNKALAYQAKLADGLEGVTTGILRERLQYCNEPAQEALLLRRLRSLNYIISLQISIERTKYVMAKAKLRRQEAPIKVSSQSGVVETKASDGMVTHSEVNQTLMDVLGGELDFLSAGASINSDQGQRELLNIGDYLSRPVIIHSGTHAVGTAITHQLSVWDLFTLKPSIRAKLRNYAYLRGNLKVRISIAGTPFHYGKVLLSYQPYARLNPTITNYLGNIVVHSAYRIPFLNYLSQATGATVMNINENRPLELTIPYMSTKPMHRLFNTGSTTITDAESFADLEYSGDLFIYSINDVASVGVNDTAVNMQIYAWMEDVEVGMSTGTIVQVTTESKDERKTGPIEAISTKIVSVSRSLRKANILPNLAFASEIAFTGLGKAAAIMGWSKPIPTNHQQIIKVEPFPNASQGIGIDTSQRISLDPMCETTIDAKVVGISEDEEVITSISSRPSFYATLNWTVTDEPMVDILAWSGVSPQIVTRYSNATWNHDQPTAMAFASTPFHYWRGDITYRIEIVASNFHRGKLAVFYEPNLYQIPNNLSALRLNKQNVRIMDLQDTNTMEFTVNWASYRAWLQVGNSNDAFMNSSIGAPLATNGNLFCNGCIFIVPFTSLQSPDLTPVHINLYAYCDNLQVACPTGSNMPTDRRIEGEIGLLGGGGEVMQVHSQSQGVQSSLDLSQVVLNPSSATTKDICKEHFGEQVLSFRSLMKRYVTTRKESLTNATASNKVITILYNIYPPNLLPYSTSAQDSRVIELFSYLRYAYLGYKGSIRTTLNWGTTGVFTGFSKAKFGLAPPTSSTTESVSYTTTDWNEALIEGSAQCVTGSVPLIHFETPFYTNNLFAMVQRDSLDDGTSDDLMDRVWFRKYQITLDYSSATLSSLKLVLDQAAGEDFTFLRFTGAPFYTKLVV